MRRSLALATIAAASALALARARAEDVDWAKEEKDALESLRELVRIETQDGGETKLLEKVKPRLEELGLAPAILEKLPGRGNLIVRLKGKGGGAPLLLMAHVDTVKAAEVEGWSAPPFAAEVKDGCLVGRGALDDKGQAALALATLRLLARDQGALARDVVLMLNADEESGGANGAAWVAREKWESLAPVGAALNEGGRCVLKDGKVVLVGIQTSEKVYNDVVLRVKGIAGHSSVPRPGNAIAKLARAIAKLEQWRPSLRVTPAALGAFQGLAKFEKDTATRQAMADLSSENEGERTRAAELLAELDPRFNALLRSTFAFTLLRGGVRVNQLPPSAEVNLNIRLLPEESLEKFLVSVRHAIRDEPEVELETILAGETSPPSSRDHPLYRAIESVAKRHFPDAAVVPILATGATDSRFLRNRGVPSYGITPFPLEEAHERSVHGPDERVLVESVKRGLRFYFDVVRTYATTPD